MKALLLGIVLLCVSASFSQCVDEANVYEFTYAGKNYELIKENKNWPDAAECAVERGGGLARIDSEEENAALFEAISAAGVVAESTTAPDGGGGAYIWLAGTDRLTEGAWIWDINDDDEGDQFWEGAVDGSPVDGLYNNWGDEPDDFGDLQDGAAMSVNGWPLGVAGEWNDINDDANEIYFFVEYDEIDDSGVEENDQKRIRFYPNPAQDRFIIQEVDPIDINVIRIYNSAGKIILIEQNYTKEGVDITPLEKGIYLVEVQQANGTIITEKLIK